MSLLIKGPEDLEAEIRDAFLKKFGRIPMPMCYRCREKVEEMGVEVNLPAESITVFVKCHGDREEMTDKIARIFERDFIQMGIAFHPLSGTRIKGVRRRE